MQLGRLLWLSALLLTQINLLLAGPVGFSWKITPQESETAETEIPKDEEAINSGDLFFRA